MAVDTKQKRAAALSFGSPARSSARTPTGASDERSRAAGLGCYFFAVSNVIWVVASRISRDGARASGISRHGSCVSLVQSEGTRTGAIK